MDQFLKKVKEVTTPLILRALRPRTPSELTAPVPEITSLRKNVIAFLEIGHSCYEEKRRERKASDPGPSYSSGNIKGPTGIKEVHPPNHP